MADERRRQQGGRGQAGRDFGGGYGAMGYGQAYGRDFGGAGYNQGFDGSWGRGYGGSIGPSDYRAPYGGESYGGGYAGGDYERSFGPRGGSFAPGGADQDIYQGSYGGGPEQAGGSFGGHRGRPIPGGGGPGGEPGRGERGAEPRYRGVGPAGYRRGEERIREDVNDRLTDDPHLDAGDIAVQVQDGEVTLEGHVQTRADRRRAEVLAEGVRGVTHVQNNLKARAGFGRRDEGIGPTLGMDVERERGINR